MIRRKGNENKDFFEHGVGSRERERERGSLRCLVVSLHSNCRAVNYREKNHTVDKKKKNEEEEFFHNCKKKKTVVL